MGKIIIFILLYLLFIGIDYEFEAISGLTLSNQQFFKLIQAIGLFLLYIIPFVILLIFLYKRWEQRLYTLPLTLFIGYFSTGWLAGETNEWASYQIIHRLGNNAIVINWLDALTAPVIEEIIKLIGVVMIVYLLNPKTLKTYLLIGACVGLGFQICEDISYIVNVATENIHEIVPQAFNRISGSVTSHWLYTALFAVGVGSVKIKHAFSIKETLLCLIAPITLHFLWNSPLNESIFVSALLSSISAYLFWHVLRLLDKELSLKKYI